MNFLKEYRIQHWWYFLGLPILGAIVTKNKLPPSILILSFLLLSFAYSWNNYFDNKKWHPISLLIPLLPLFLVVLFLFHTKNHIRLLSILFLFISGTYSLPPFRLKIYPFICTLSNGIGFSLLFLLGVSEINRRVIVLYFYIFFLLLVAQLIHELEHSSYDQRENIFTTVIFLGPETTEILITILLLSSQLLLLYFSFPLFVISLLIFLNVQRLFKNRKNYTYFRKIFRIHGLMIAGILLIYFYLS